jgi:redox-sensing transcriptional repressor
MMPRVASLLASTNMGERRISMEEKEISRAVVKRLPRYYRYLGDLLAEGVERISSNELSERMQVTASQIRQDLNNFGGFGQQGYGYNVKFLYSEIGKILGLDKTYHMIIIGAGNLGQALANYVKFEKRGFKVVGIFDVNSELIGQTVRGIQIRHADEVAEFMQTTRVDIATLTLPRKPAEEMAEILVENGIKAIWNFAHLDLHVPGDIIVENVHLSESLMRLSYNINRYAREHQTEERVEN